MFKKLQVFKAIKQNDTTKLKQLIDEGVQINKIEDSYGLTPLMKAVECKSFDCLKVLINSGADINQNHTNMGIGLLFYASEKNYVTSLKFLIDHGAEVNLVTDLNKSTALMGASHKGNIECVKLLLEAGAKTDCKNSWNKTALDCAIENDNQEIVALLKEVGAPESYESVDGNDGNGLKQDNEFTTDEDSIAIGANAASNVVIGFGIVYIVFAIIIFFVSLYFFGQDTRGSSGLAIQLLIYSIFLALPISMLFLMAYVAKLIIKITQFQSKSLEYMQSLNEKLDRV